MSVDLLVCWVLVTLRSVGVLSILPTLGSHPLPTSVRVGMGLLLATLLYGIVPHANFTGWLWTDLAVAAIGEVTLGLGMGFVVRFTFGAVEFAGRAISSEIGLSGAPGTDAPLPASEPLATLLVTFAGVIFFVVGGHLGVLGAFARSFDFAPAGHPVWSARSALVMITNSARLIELGLRIAAPVRYMTTEFQDIPWRMLELVAHS